MTGLRSHSVKTSQKGLHTSEPQLSSQTFAPTPFGSCFGGGGGVLGGPLGCKQMSFSAHVSQCPTAMYRARLAAELALSEQLSCHDTKLETLQEPPLVTACIALDMQLIQRIPY